MGVVWAATEIAAGKQVALKLLRPGIAENTTGRRRFLREARAIAAVRHPNVVTIHDVVGLADGTPVLVMDLLQGESLREKLSREGTIPLPELARLLLPAISAVGTAHARGIIHRDLKPDNIFLAEGVPGPERVKVLDFGIAKLTATEGDAAETGAITNTGALLGTPHYMSPEQILGERDVDHRSDIWSIGVILYECLTAVRPTDADSVGKVLKRILTGSLTPLGELAPGLPEDMAGIVDRMLTSDRERRPAGLLEIARVLERHGAVPYPPFGPPAPPTSQPSGAPRRAPVPRAILSPLDTLMLEAPPVEARRLLATLPAGRAPEALVAPPREPAAPPAAAPQRGLPTPAHTPVGLARPTLEPADAGGAPAQASVTGAAGRSARVRWATVAAVALVVTLGATGALLWRGGGPAPTPPPAPARGAADQSAPCPEGLGLPRR